MNPEHTKALTSGVVKGLNASPHLFRGFPAWFIVQALHLGVCWRRRIQRQSCGITQGCAEGAVLSQERKGSTDGLAQLGH